MSEPKLRCISMDLPGGDPEGIIWANPGPPDAKALGERVMDYVNDLADGESVEIVFMRHDLTQAELDALPEL